MPSLGSRWELLPKERGKTYKVKPSYTVVDPATGERVTVPEGYEFDGYTFAPDLPDLIPASTHDYLYDPDGAGRKWDSGNPVTKAQADALLKHLMEISEDEVTCFAADAYAQGVKHGSWPAWLKGSAILGMRRLLAFFS